MNKLSESAIFDDALKSFLPRHGSRVETKDIFVVKDKMRPVQSIYAIEHFYDRKAFELLESVEPDVSPAPLLQLTAADHAEKLQFHLRQRLHTGRTQSRPSQQEVKDPAGLGTRSVVGYSVFYRTLWAVMMVLGMTWGLVVGLSIGGDGAIGTMTMITGTIVILTLTLTLVVAGRQSRPRE